MTTAVALDGLRRFMAAVDPCCAPGTDLTTLLVRQGFSSDQAAVLRRHHRDAFVTACHTLIMERPRGRHDGDRLAHIVERRYGLDGAAPETLAALGARLGLSRERVRQLEETGVRSCRARRLAWIESLAEIAVGFVGEPAGPAQEARAAPVPVADGDARERDARTRSADRAGGPAQRESTPAVRAQAATMDADITACMAKPLLPTLTARVLVGDRAPEVEALVAHHQLPHDGALHGCNRKDVARLIARMRAASAPPSPTGPAGSCAPDGIAPEDIVVMVADIRAAVAESLSDAMVAHVLFGSHGPRIDAVRTRYHPPHDGALRALGMRRVALLVYAVADSAAQ